MPTQLNVQSELPGCKCIFVLLALVLFPSFQHCIMFVFVAAQLVQDLSLLLTVHNHCRMAKPADHTAHSLHTHSPHTHTFTSTCTYTGRRSSSSSSFRSINKTETSVSQINIFKNVKNKATPLHLFNTGQLIANLCHCKSPYAII